MSNIRSFFYSVSSMINSYIYAIRRNTYQLKKSVMFFTFQGSFVCNPKYICEALHRLAPDVECIWVTYQKTNQIFPSYVKQVVFGEPEYYTALYQSKVIVDNAFNYQKRCYKKRNQQYYIETMHGSLGIKRIGPETSSNRRRNARGFQNGRQADYIISNSDFENMVFRSSFWKETPILMLGHARNDLLTESNSSHAQKFRSIVRKFYHLPEEAKLAMYAPTFQREISAECEPLDLELVRRSLENKFGGDWYLLNRLHPRDVRIGIKRNQPKILDGNAYEDIQELMTAIDFGITDYSSWIFDYVVTRKAGMLYVPDLDQYQNSTGFYYPLNTTPFPIAKNCRQVEQVIQAFDYQQFDTNLSVFLKDKGCVDDGKASERAAKVIVDLLNNKKPANIIK